jgi:hypothetical protein
MTAIVFRHTRLFAVFLLAAGALLLQPSAVQAQTGAKQPNMQSALASLTSARTALQKASANKGGHRVKAIELINQAIVEVQAGIAAAN